MDGMHASSRLHDAFAFAAENSRQQMALSRCLPPQQGKDVIAGIAQGKQILLRA
jgi:hypothetical protein